MTASPQTIQLLVAPVVMISANGLICLALYNRLAAIVGRARMFHKERFDALTRLTALPLEQQSDPPAVQLRRRATALEDQGGRILRRARLVRTALIWLLAAVVCMLVCSLTLGLSTVVAECITPALVVFCAGVGSMMVAMVLAIMELAGALEPVTAEGFTLENVEQTDQA
jgi:hypothetical protein